STGRLPLLHPLPPGDGDLPDDTTRADGSWGQSPGRLSSRLKNLTPDAVIDPSRLRSTTFARFVELKLAGYDRTSLSAPPDEQIMTAPIANAATPLLASEDRALGHFAAAWARYPIIWSPQVSPDGRWLAWTWTGPDETGNVWIAP